MKIFYSELRTGEVYGWVRGSCWQARLVVGRQETTAIVLDLNEVRVYDLPVGRTSSFEVDLYLVRSRENGG